MVLLQRRDGYLQTVYLCRLNCKAGPSEYYDVTVFVLKTNYKLCPKKCKNLKQASFQFTYVSVLLTVRKKDEKSSRCICKKQKLKKSLFDLPHANKAEEKRQILL